MAKRKVVEDWQKLVRDEIEFGDVEKLSSITAELDALKTEAFSRLTKLKQGVGCGVIMKNSNEEQEEDDRYNTCFRTVWASFTAGPSTAPFSIIFTIINDEGDESIVIEGDLFHFKNNKCSEVTDEKIEEFLEKAGLENAVALNQPDGDDEDEDDDDEDDDEDNDEDEGVDEAFIAVS